MYVSHYLEFQNHVTGGIRESVRQQRKMLDDLEIAYTEEIDLEVDIVHLNLMGPRSLLFAKRATLAEVPVVIHTHVTAEDFRDSMRFSNTIARPLKPYLQWAYGSGDLLICPSTYTERVINDYTDVDTTVISNGVDTEKLEGFADLRDEYLNRYDLTPPVVFMVGHVYKRKGLETFVTTARQLPSLDFVWFGPLELPLKDRETKRLITESPDNCTFTGIIDDIREAYAVGDIFYFPTYVENEGMTLLEALMTGKAIVVRDIEAFDWLEDGVHCLKRDGNFDDAIEALCDADYRAHLGVQAEELSENFHLENVTITLKACYEGLLDNG